MERSEVSALLSPSRRRSRLRAQRDAPPDVVLTAPAAASTRVQITINALEDEAFLRALEELLQQHVHELEDVDLVLGAKQINYLAFRLHEALEPKRDPQTNVIQAWTIQPQAQLKIKMSSHIQVLKLSTILREVRRLRIHQQSLLRSPIEMDIFPSLRVIEIVHTEVAVLGNVHFFARQLCQFRLEHTPLDSLSQVLSPTTTKEVPLTMWKKLESLRINCCSLPTIDACFNNLQAVQVVDLAWNEIAAFEMPADIATLQWLDLCHNKLNTFPPLSQLHNLKVLDLSVNQIQSLQGVQALSALIDLDISNNELRDIGEIELLTELRNLRRLVARENPMARRPDFRREVLFYLGERVEVDDDPWTSVEIQSMKGSRQFRSSEVLLAQSTSLPWPSAEATVDATPRHETSGTMMYPLLPRAGGMLAREANIAPPPRIYSPRRRKMLAQHQSTARSGAPQNSLTAVDRAGTRSSLEETLTEVTEEVDETEQPHGSLIKTVDDFFRLQSIDLNDGRTPAKPSDVEIPVDHSITYDTDSDSSSEQGRNRSRKYTESDFMRDFEEEEAFGVNDTDGRRRRSSSATHKQPKQYAQPSGGVTVRVLLSAEDAAVFDLTYGIDGLAATVDVKSNEILETLHVPDRESSIAFSRRMLDVVAIGTSTQSPRANIVIFKLRKLDNSLNTVTYRIETKTTLARIIAPVLGHFLGVTPGHQQPTACVCSNCGGISHLSPEFIDSTLHHDGQGVNRNSAIIVLACLLCASRNVREISCERMLALHAADGMPHLAKRVKPPTERHTQVEVGFSVEEHEFSAREVDDIHECVLISSNGIREVMNTTRQRLG